MAPSTQARQAPWKHHHKHHGTWNDKHWRWVPNADGDWRVQGYIFHHKHKPPKHHFRGPGPKPPRRVAAATSTAAGAATAAGEGRPAGAYAGAFGVPQATRLLDSGGLRPAPGEAERARRDGHGRRGPVADPTERRRHPLRPAPDRRRRRPARPRRHLGPRPPLVARPDDPLRPAAGRADGAGLPRLVRDLRRRRVESPADDRSVEPLPGQLLRLLPRPLQGGDGRPGDAAVAERRRKREGRAERELRPRDDGALQPRRRPRRLHRGRHPRTGARR